MLLAIVERHVAVDRNMRGRVPLAERQQEQRPREDRQTGDIGPAFGVLSNPPNQVELDPELSLLL